MQFVLVVKFSEVDFLLIIVLFIFGGKNIFKLAHVVSLPMPHSNKKSLLYLASIVVVSHVLFPVHVTVNELDVLQLIDIIVLKHDMMQSWLFSQLMVWFSYLLLLVAGIRLVNIASLHSLNNNIRVDRVIRADWMGIKLGEMRLQRTSKL